MPLQFEIFDGDSGAFTDNDPAAHRVAEQLEQLYEDYDSGETGEKVYLAALERLRGAAPDVINVYTHIADRFHNQGKPKKALEAALLGLKMANSHIPEGFTGHIEWGHLDNRPYLRLMHYALMSYLRLKRHREAVTMIDLMLARNPNDNQGVRHLLGSEALRAGQYDRAYAVLAEGADDFPPYFYEMAMCCMLKRDWVGAATAMRRGIAANPYIAEFLSGNPYPLPLAIWHDSDLAEPETAIDYVQQYGGLWQEQRDGGPFARWLFNHPKVLAERAAVMECKEALLWEHDTAVRARLVARERKLRAEISDALSRAIVVQRVSEQGKLMWPWEAARHHLSPYDQD